MMHVLEIRGIKFVGNYKNISNIALSSKCTVELHSLFIYTRLNEMWTNKLN